MSKNPYPAAHNLTSDGLEANIVAYLEANGFTISGETAQTHARNTYPKLHALSIPMSLRAKAIWFLESRGLSVVQDPAQLYKETILDDGPLYYWGESLEPVVGGVDLTFTGAPVEVDWARGKALSFDGVLDTARTATPIDFSGRTKLVYEMVFNPAWGQPTGHGEQGRWNVFLHAAVGASLGTQMDIYNYEPAIESCSRYGEAYETLCGYRLVQFIDNGTHPHHHLAVVHDILVEGVTTIKTYLDGVLLGTYTAGRNAGYPNPSVFGSGILWIMGDVAGNSTKGTIQHFAIYADLSEAKIAAHAALV